MCRPPIEDVLGGEPVVHEADTEIPSSAGEGRGQQVEAHADRTSLRGPSPRCDAEVGCRVGSCSGGQRLSADQVRLLGGRRASLRPLRSSGRLQDSDGASGGRDGSALDLAITIHETCTTLIETPAQLLLQTNRIIQVSSLPIAQCVNQQRECRRGLLGSCSRGDSPQRAGTSPPAHGPAFHRPDRPLLGLGAPPSRSPPLA